MTMDIHVVDPTGMKSEDAAVPGNVAAGRIMAKLVELMDLPSRGGDGQPLSYRFAHKASGRQIDDRETLQDAGVRDGDVLRVVAEIAAGGPEVRRLIVDLSDEPAAARSTDDARGTDLARKLAHDIQRLRF